MLPSLRAASNQSRIGKKLGFGKEPIVVVCSLDLAIKELHESSEFLQHYTEVSSRIKHSSKEFHAHPL